MTQVGASRAENSRVILFVSNAHTWIAIRIHIIKNVDPKHLYLKKKSFLNQLKKIV